MNVEQSIQFVKITRSVLIFLVLMLVSVNQDFKSLVIYAKVRDGPFCGTDCFFFLTLWLQKILFGGQ